MTREDWMENFGENLKEILIHKGINQRELSDLTGISASTISDYVNAKKMVSGESIVKIMYALDGIQFSHKIDYFDLLDFGETIE